MWSILPDITHSICSIAGLGKRFDIHPSKHILTLPFNGRRQSLPCPFSKWCPRWLPCESSYRQAGWSCYGSSHQSIHWSSILHTVPRNSREAQGLARFQAGKVNPTSRIPSSSVTRCSFLPFPTLRPSQEFGLRTILLWRCLADSDDPVWRSNHLDSRFNLFFMSIKNYNLDSFRCQNSSKCTIVANS